MKRPRQHVSARSEEMRALREHLAAGGPLWGWGTDEGLIPWEDRSGRTMLVFWTSEERAVEENASDAGRTAGERAIRYPLDQVLAKMSGWQAAGLGVIGLEPRGGRTLDAPTPDEFIAMVGGRPTRRLP